TGSNPRCSRRGPSHPSLPSHRSNASPPTTGGIASGTKTATVTACLSLELVLASQSPTGSPNRAAKRVAALAAKRVTASDGNAPSPKNAGEPAKGPAPSKAKSGPTRYPSISAANKSSGHGRLAEALALMASPDTASVAKESPPDFPPAFAAPGATRL